MDALAGSISSQYGIYKNHCCGDELVLYKGVAFPNCKKHRDIPTRWHMVSTISMGPLDSSEFGGGGQSNGNPAA